MGLKKAIEDWEKCGLKDEEIPGEGEACKTCPLNKPTWERQEHPTFCENLNAVDCMYASYPEPQHSMAP